jgi:hypothetical protein
MGTLGLDHQRAADQAERRRILRYRWLIWVSIVMLSLCNFGFVFDILPRPAGTFGLVFRFLLPGLWLLAGLGLWRSQQLDSRLKNRRED